MKWRKEKDKFVIIIEAGEEIISSLQEFAHKNDVGGGFFFGLGAVRDCVLGYYDEPAAKYLKKQITSQREILSLLGNISLVEEKPFAHCHIQLGDAEMNAEGGHLFEGHVSPACEIMLFPTSEKIERKIVPGRQFRMIKL